MISPQVEDSRIRFALRSLERKQCQVLSPRQLVEEAVDEFGDNLAVSWSGGHCSTAVLHMALEINPKITVVFGDTTVLYPEDYAFRDLLLSEWALNLIVTKPVKPFWQCIKEYGLPTVRRQYSKFKSLRKRHTYQEKTGKPACCWFCKDKPFLLASKEHKIKATLVGLRCSESRARMYYAADYGQKHYAKRYKICKINPILFWRATDLKHYFAANELPENEVYTKLKLERNGCMPCTGFINWEKQLARLNPKMYRYIQKLRGVFLMDDFIEVENQLADQCGIETLPKTLEAWF